MAALQQVDAAACSSVAAADLLTAMLHVRSLSGSESGLARLLVERLGAAGFDVRVDAVGNVIAEWGCGGQTVALVGHMDTVAGHIEVRREGDLLFGRGAVDAKGPLAAAITAVSRQERRGERRFVIVAAVEEETSSRGARHLAATMAAPERLIVLEPSGWDAVTVGYKGSLRVRWSTRQEHGHGAGRNPGAADRCVEFVRSVQDHAREVSGDAGIFDRLDVRVLRIASQGDGLSDGAQVDLGMRLPPACDVDALLDRVHGLAVGGNLAVLGCEAAVRTSRGSALARGFARAIRGRGGAARFKLKTGTADLNVLVPAWGCPALAYGPGDSHLDHTPQEHVSVTELNLAVGVLDAALREP